MTSAQLSQTYHDSITPMSPDMVPLIFDTGASISISSHRIDFITPLWLAQHITIKGIASGLSAQGVGDKSYTFNNDQGHEQKLTLQNCLYNPQSVNHLILSMSLQGHHWSAHRWSICYTGPCAPYCRWSSPMIPTSNLIHQTRYRHKIINHQIPDKEYKMTITSFAAIISLIHVHNTNSN